MLNNPEKYKACDITLDFDRKMISDFNFNLQRAHRKVYGDKYIGEFKNDMMDGEGFYQWNTNKVYYGQWKNDQMHGKGEFFWPDGEYYQGYYEKDERHGEGIMIWNPYRRHRGFWAFGVRHGYGESI